MRTDWCLIGAFTEIIMNLNKVEVKNDEVGVGKGKKKKTHVNQNLMVINAINGRHAEGDRGRKKSTRYKKRL